MLQSVHFEFKNKTSDDCINNLYLVLNRDELIDTYWINPITLCLDDGLPTVNNACDPVPAH